MNEKLTQTAVGAVLKKWWLFDSWWSKEKTTAEKAIVEREYYKTLAKKNVSAIEFASAARQCVTHCSKFPAPSDIIGFVEEYRNRRYARRPLALPEPTCSDKQAEESMENIRVLSKLITLFSKNPHNTALEIGNGISEYEDIYRPSYSLFLANLEKYTPGQIRAVVEQIEAARESLSHGNITTEQYAQQVKEALCRQEIA